MKPSFSNTKRPGQSLKAKLGLAAIAVATFLGGCASGPQETPYQVAQPSAKPIATQTSFSQSLTCMDNLFYDFGIRDIGITTKGIPDSTGEIETGTRDMLINAVGRMSQRSRAFSYIDYERVFGGQLDSALYAQQDQLYRATYYIRGAITTFDDSVSSRNTGIGVSIEDFGAGVNRDATSSVVGVDMNVGEVQTGLIVPGVSSNNRIAVTRRGIGADANAEVEVLGGNLAGFLQFSNNKSEGMHTAVRTLIELNTIETLGKLARVPYWRCLSVDGTNPEVREETQRWFYAMEESERVSFTSRALTDIGFFSDGEVQSQTRALSDAIGRYKSARGLLANGEITDELFGALLAEELSLNDLPPRLRAHSNAQTQTAVPELFISMSDALELPVYSVGQPLSVRVRLNADAHTYCYYQDGSGVIARIFPNRFSPDSYVKGGSVLAIPGQGDGFEILFEQSRANEEVRCFATRRPIQADATPLVGGADLTPINANSLDQIERIMRSFGGDDMVSQSQEFLVR